MEKIGDLYEINSELIIEWKVKNIFSLSDEKNKRYESPTFYFSGTSWELWLYPNGETENKSEGWISLYLMRMATGIPVTLDISLSLKTVDAKSVSTVSSTCYFNHKKLGYGAAKLISKAELIGRKVQLVPSDELTVICTLKNIEQNFVSGSLFNRLKDVSDNLKGIYKKEKNTDANLKFDDGKIATHKVILETRSPILSDIIAKINDTDEVPISDTDKKTMKMVLEYIYSGDMERLTIQNVFSLYDAATKYDINDIKVICLDYIKRNLSVEWVCDVMKFAGMCKEKDLALCAKEYFKENVRKVVETENWEKFCKEKPDLSIALLKYAVIASVENQDIKAEVLGSLIKTLLPE